MTWFVIGVGNTLRRDDGLGPWLAERIDAWHLPGIEVRTVHQITPELASQIANHDNVLFLDADRTEKEPRLVELEVSSAGPGLGHAMSPSELLAWAELLDGRRPPAWIALAPGAEFGFGEELSEDAMRAGEKILEKVERLLRQDSRCTKSA